MRKFRESRPALNVIEFCKRKTINDHFTDVYVAKHERVMGKVGPVTDRKSTTTRALKL